MLCNVNMLMKHTFLSYYSLWGKYTQRQLLTNCVYVKSRLELARLLNDPTKEIVGELILIDCIFFQISSIVFTRQIVLLKC